MSSNIKNLNIDLSKLEIMFELTIKPETPAVVVEELVTTSLRALDGLLVEAAGLDGAAAVSKAPLTGRDVTVEHIRQAMKGAELSSQQSGGVNLPLIQSYVDKLLAGEIAPAIKVENGIIIDGNHRYIAGKICGIEPPIQPWRGSVPANVISWDNIPIQTVGWPKW
jgi:hypothetical protein